MTAATMTPLFPGCPLPGCLNIVTAEGEVCAECVTVLGPYLRPVDLAPADTKAPGQAAQEFPTPDPAAPVLADAPDEWRRNQQCWCCEERRTCHADPQHPDRMICRTCEAIPVPGPARTAGLPQEAEAGR